MNVKNCRGCGRLFNYISGMPLCPACREAAEKKFTEVKDFIRDNVRASIKEVSEKCEVDENQIRQWIREERLVLDPESGIGIQCETCGATIASGRYCEKCKASLMNGLSAAGRQQAQPMQPQRNTRENPRMRFLDNK